LKSPREIGKELKEARVRAGMSIIDVAANMKITRQTLYRWERGEDTPRAHVYFRLIELYEPEDPEDLDPLGTSQ
jgi:predicted transcriptional regulator